MLCCGVPDHGNQLDGESSPPANKVTKVGGDRPASASKPIVNIPEEKPAPVQTEKDALRTADSEKIPTISDEGKDIETEPSKPVGNGEVSRPKPDLRDQALPDLPKGESSSQGERAATPIVAPIPTTAESTRNENTESQQKNDAEGDVKMEDTEPVLQEAVVPVARNTDTSSKTTLPLPPPPPVPEPETIQEPEQKWLLPPITPRFQGKKCLVLDLDETLVHSSFKVHTPLESWQTQILTYFRFFTRPTSPSQSRSRDNITTFMWSNVLVLTSSWSEWVNSTKW